MHLLTLNIPCTMVCEIFTPGELYLRAEHLFVLLHLCEKIMLSYEITGKSMCGNRKMEG